MIQRLSLFFTDDAFRWRAFWIALLSGTVLGMVCSLTGLAREHAAPFVGLATAAVFLGQGLISKPPRELSDPGGSGAVLADAAEWGVGGSKEGPPEPVPVPERSAETELVDAKTDFAGCIEVVCGPMFSGKSEELIRRLRRAMISGKRVQVFKPIVSPGDGRLSAIGVKNAAEIIFELDWRAQVVGIDGANFFGTELAEVARQLADDGKHVIVVGLDTDYLGRPFDPIPELLCVAESITKTLAVCVRCGNPAGSTQRLVDSEDLILVGAAGLYEARCRRCFESRRRKEGVARTRGSVMSYPWGHE